MERYADLHLHTTASDGTNTPKEVVSLAKGAGLSVISVTDHDSVDGIAEAAEAAKAFGLVFIPGVEFTSLYDGDGGKFRLHILGYGIDPASESILNVIEEGRRIRRKKHSLRLDYLRRVHNISFSDAELSMLPSDGTVGKLHIARLLMKRSMADSVGDAIKKYMSAPDFPEGCLPHRFVIDGIKRSGGIPIYAHPFVDYSEDYLSFAEISGRIRRLSDDGMMGVECYHSSQSSGEAAFLHLTTMRAGLLISGGSDFHGENKTVKIGELMERRQIMAERLTVLSELVE